MGRYSCLIVLLVSVQAKEIGRLVKAPKAHAHETLRSRMQEVEANVHRSGEHATVSFAHEGQHHHYSLISHQVYSEGAQFFDGGKRIETPLGRTFRSREQGRWASMTVHSDGKITGLFEHKGVMMEIQPVAHQDRKVAHALLANYTGKRPAHLINNIVLAEILDATRTSRRLLTKPTIDSENPPGKNNNNIPSAANNVVPTAAQTASQWGGVPWFPGCYTGDNQQHIFEIGVTSDQAALDMYPSDLSSKVESIVNDASLVYEHQMNIKLQIGYSKQMGSASNPNYGACPSVDGDICSDRLSQTRNFLKDGTLPFAGAVHHFTGCGNSWGVMGLAYVNAICNTVAGGAYNCGSNKLAGSSPWLTFAHELGHNFNGKHSFENGQGTTGGIMDYGDGKLNGHFQFNTDFRKTQMCSTMDQFVNNCPAGANSNFRVAPAATTTTVAATTAVATTVATTTAAATAVVTTTAAATTVGTTTAAATTAVATTVVSTTVVATTVATTTAAATTAVAATVATTTAAATTAVATTVATTTAAATTVFVPPHVFHFVVWLLRISNARWVSSHFADFALALAQAIADAFGIDISRIHVTNSWGGRRLNDQTSDLNVDVSIDDDQGDVTADTVTTNIAKVLPLVNAKLAPKNVQIGDVQFSTGGTTTPQITVTATPLVGGASPAKYASLGKSAVEQASDETQVQPTPLLMFAICLLVIGGVVGVVIRVVKRESHSGGVHVPAPHEGDPHDESILE